MGKKKFIILLSFVLVLSIMGCGHLNIPFLGKESKGEEVPGRTKTALISTDFVEKGRIVNAEKLKQGKNIAIIPFTAGQWAESTDELDRVALMIIKGVADAFADDKTGNHAHFNILTAENSDEADLIVKGHITIMGKPSRLKRWTSLSNKINLSVEGKIIDIQSGEAVVIFTDHTQAGAGEDDYKQLGYDIGKNIGRFILSGIN